MNTEQNEPIKKTREKLTFAEFCMELQGYQFFITSHFDKEVHKYELFFFYNLEAASDAFYILYSKKREV